MEQENMGNRKKTTSRLQNQPIACPWIPSQPYLSTQTNKNKSSDNTRTKAFQNKAWTQKASASEESKLISSTQSTTSTSHFFYFLRLMQLFPDTHPATLHTVLTLTKNNFFCAIDKLLHARKCKSAYYKSQCYYKVANKSQSSNNATYHSTKTFEVQNVQVQQHEYVPFDQNSGSTAEEIKMNDQQLQVQVPDAVNDMQQQQDQFLNPQQVTVIGIERPTDSDDDEFKDQGAKTEIIRIRIENNDEDMEIERDTIPNQDCQEAHDSNETEDQLLLNDVNQIITNSSVIDSTSNTEDATIATKNEQLFETTQPEEEISHIVNEEIQLS